MWMSKDLMGRKSAEVSATAALQARLSQASQSVWPLPGKYVLVALLGPSVECSSDDNSTVQITQLHGCSCPRTAT
jgi:hypothetical protein